MHTGQLSYTDVAEPGRVVLGVLRTTTSIAGGYADVQRRVLFPNSDAEVYDFGAANPFSVPSQATFHGVVNAGGERHHYEDAAAFAAGLLPGWDAASFVFHTDYLYGPALYVSMQAAAESVTIEASSRSDGDLQQVLGVAAESSGATRGRLRRRIGWLSRRRGGLLKWVLGIVSALLVAYVVYVLGWA
jgi:hypothetical protein